MPTAAPAHDAAEPTTEMPTATSLPPVPHPTHRGVRRALAVLAALAGVAAIGWGALALVELGARHTTTERASYAGVRSIEVHAASGSVTIAQGPARSRVEVTTRVTRGLRAGHHSARVTGSTLHLHSDCSWFASISCSASYTVKVPAGLPVRVFSAAGDVRVDGVRASSIQLGSAAGDVRATGVRAARISASSSAGDVRVEALSVPRELTATSSAGDVRLDVPDAVYAVQADTSAGDRRVEARQDPASPNRIVARSSAGDVVIRSRP
jgi:DUF4097 and DUF4098 domain-containing protein YvlB